MEEQNITQDVTPEQQEQAFREKVPHYIICFQDQCPLHEQCLRWLVGRYADPMPLVQKAINPLNPSLGGEQCAMFRKNQRVVKKCGLTNLYHEMPGYMEKRIRGLLIMMWGRNKYFEARRGARLINSEMQDDVATACRQHGWQGPIVYDGEQVDWDW